MLRAWGSHAKTFVACLARNAAICCIWPLEPGPEPQMARNVCSSPPRGRRWLEMAARACPGAAEYSTGASRVCPGAAECAMGAAATPEPQNARRAPLEPALEPQNARQVLLESALEPQHARKVPLEPTAVRCVRFLRSKWPLEKYCPLFVYSRHRLWLGSASLRACYARAHTTVVFQLQL